MLKNDRWICETATSMKMIDPFEPALVRDGVVSYGPSSYGYDFRVADVFQVPEPTGGVFDPKNADAFPMREVRGPHIDIAPNSYVLGRSFEYFRIPRDVLAIVYGKSTYARCGVLVNVTPLEPEWEGVITMCIVNNAPFPVRLYSGEGAAQVLFLGASETCVTSYADRKGKYQGQKDIKSATI